MDFIGKSPVSIPVLVIGKLALFGSGLFLLVKIYRPDAMLFDSIYTQIIGVILYVAGLLAVIVSIVHLGRSIAVGIPDRETELKTRGLYRLSRNPIYVGAYMMCAGSCLIAIHPLNILLFFIAMVIHARIITKEEEFLEKRFGNQWLGYKRSVPRYIGSTRSRRDNDTNETHA